MAIDFPNTPSVNDLFTNGVQTWKWTGATWDLLVIDSPPGSGISANPIVAGYTYQSVPGVVSSSFGSLALSASRMHYCPFVVDKTITVSSTACNVSTGGSTGSQLRFAIYNSSNSLIPTTLVSDLGVVTTTTSGTKSITGLSVIMAPGIYLFAVGTNTAPPSVYIVRGDPTFGFSTDPIGFGNVNRVAYAYSYASWTFGSAPSTGIAPTNTPYGIQNAGWNYMATMGWTVN